MQQIIKNEEKSYSNKIKSNEGFECQTNESRSSQQLSPSFRTSNQLQNIIEDQKSKGSKEDQNQSKNEDVKQKKQEKDVNQGGELQQNQNLNRSSMQTLNNSIDKLFSCCTTEDYQDMTKYIIFKDFQSDSKANSKYGSKANSKQQTPSITPRFNLYPSDMLQQNQNSYFLEKPQKNSSSYQSQESFCFKEENYINNNINLNYFKDQNINPFHNFYQISTNQHFDGQEENVASNQNNSFYEYVNSQKNCFQEIEKQQQLNSYHLPQQKKKKLMINNIHQHGNQKNNHSQYNNHQQTRENLVENNKQHSIMLMMSQAQNHSKKHKLNKLKGLVNDNNSNIINSRVCQTEPAQVDYEDENELYMQDYKYKIANPENNNSGWREFEGLNDTAENRRKQQLVKINDKQQFGNNSGKKISQKNKYKFENGQDNQELSYETDNSYYNEEELQDIDQLKQNMISKQIKLMQQNIGSSQNPNYNNFINQKQQQNQINKIKQLGMGQLEINMRTTGKANQLYPNQIDHQNRIIKRINTNPNGVGQTQVRVGSEDSRQINKIQQQNMQKNLQVTNGENFKNKSNANNGFDLNENNLHNTQQRKFRQLSAQKYNSHIHDEQNPEYKNNHIIDEEYNNDSFLNLSNVPNEINTTLPEGHINQQMKQQQQFKYLQQEQIQNNNMQLYSTSQTKRQNNFKNLQDDNNHIQNSILLEKQMIKKKLQEFEKKKQINLNIQPNTNTNKIQLKSQTTTTQSATAAATAAAISAAQQAKKNSSQSLKKKNKSISPNQGKPLDNILEVSQRLECSALVQQNFYERQQDYNNENILDKKKLQPMHNYNIHQLNGNSELQQNQNISSRNATNDFDSHNQQKFICKTEGDDSSNTFQIVNNIEQDLSKNTKITQDNQQLQSSASSINRFGNTLSNQLHENQLAQTKSDNSKFFVKQGKRIQSAHSNQNNFSTGQNNIYNQQLTTNLMTQPNSLVSNFTGPPHQLQQIQNRPQRGRFNSYHNSSSQQNNNLSINSNQSLSKKLNPLPQSFTPNSNQPNSLTNNLIKTQIKKRSFTPLSNANNQNLLHPGQLKDPFFLNQNEQSLISDMNANAKKVNRNQKNYSAHTQSEKDQMNLSGSSPFVKPQSPLQYQQFAINNSQQQTQIHTFPNLQKQLIKRSEIGGSNSNQINQQNQQYQQLQRSSSRQAQTQNLSLIANYQPQQQKSRQIINSNNNSIMNQTHSNKLNKIQ